MNPFLTSDNGCPSPSLFLDFQAPDTTSEANPYFFDLSGGEPLSRKINNSIEAVKFPLDQTKLKGLELFMDEIETTALHTLFFQDESLTKKDDSSLKEEPKEELKEEFLHSSLIDAHPTPTLYSCLTTEPPSPPTRVLRKRKLDSEYEVPKEARLAEK